MARRFRVKPGMRKGEAGNGNDRPFDRLRDRSAGDSGPVVRQAHHPARPALRQAQGPVGGLRDRPAGDSGPVVRQAHHPARPALRQAQGPAGGRFRAGGSTGSGTGRREIPGRWFDRLTIRPDRPFDKLRARSLRQAQRPARYPFFCISDGVAPNSLAKQRVKYFGSLKPTS